MRVWFLTNGLGEDRAAALVAAALFARQPDADVLAAALVTRGEAFLSRGVQVELAGTEPRSGGFSDASITTALRDLRALAACVRYVRALRRLVRPADVVIAAGDTFLLGLAHLAIGRPAVHLALAKSVHGRPHSRLEHSLLRRWSNLVFARDEATADRLRGRRVSAEFQGNALVDRDLPGARAASTAVVDRGVVPLVLLLPGSRREAPENFARLLDVAALVPDPARWVCAWPPTVAVQPAIEAATQAGWASRQEVVTRGATTVEVRPGEFDRLAPSADLVIGLAGTANEQVAALGKPIVSLVGAGPQTSAKRMREQERLLGGAARFVHGPPAVVAAEVTALLRAPGERDRRGHLGAARLGPPGAAARIADRILELVAATR